MYEDDHEEETSQSDEELVKKVTNNEASTLPSVVTTGKTQIPDDLLNFVDLFTFFDLFEIVEKLVYFQKIKFNCPPFYPFCFSTFFHLFTLFTIFANFCLVARVSTGSAVQQCSRQGLALCPRCHQRTLEVVPAR